MRYLQDHADDIFEPSRNSKKYLEHMVGAALEAFELPDQAARLFLPVPGLAVGGLGLLLVAAADSLHLLRHRANHFQARGALVAAILRLHAYVDQHLHIPVFNAQSVTRKVSKTAGSSWRW